MVILYVIHFLCVVAISSSDIVLQISCMYAALKQQITRACNGHPHARLFCATWWFAPSRPFSFELDVNYGQAHIAMAVRKSIDFPK